MIPVDRGRVLLPDSLHFHVATLRQWSKQAHIPDPVDYGDFVEMAQEVSRVWAADYPQEGIELFPYPKASGENRWLTFATPREHVMLRAAAAPVTELVMAHVPSTTYSGRLATPPPNWTFRRNLYFKFVQAAIRQIRKWECAGVVRTDVSAYFPSIPIERLLKQLWDLHCSPEYCRFLIQTFLTWQDVHAGLRGLPIGIEACSLLGTLYLAPVDRALLTNVVWLCRYMDDMTYGYRAGITAEQSYEVIDDALARLDLKRSIAKTESADNPVDAADLLRRRDLAYVEAYVQRVPGIRLQIVRDFFDEHVVDSDPVDLAALHKCLRAFGSATDPYATAKLLTQPRLFDADPRAAANYLLNFKGNMDLARMAARRAVRPGVHPASRVHLLRVAAGVGRLGGPISDDILSLAVSRLTTPERVWSLWAYGRSARYDLADVDDVVVDAPYAVRRSGILTLRGRNVVNSSSVAARFAGDSEELRLTALWAAAA